MSVKILIAVAAATMTNISLKSKFDNIIFTLNLIKTTNLMKLESNLPDYCMQNYRFSLFVTNKQGQFAVKLPFI